jgi:hypothetical protein
MTRSIIYERSEKEGRKDGRERSGGDVKVETFRRMRY